MPHPVTSVTTRERPSPRAAAPFRPSAHDKPQRHENHLRGARKRPLRGLHEKSMGRLRRGTRKTATSKESVSPLFDNGLRIGAKIDEQTKLAAGQPKPLLVYLFPKTASKFAVDLVDRTANGVALVWIYHLTTHDANYSKNLHPQKMHIANNPCVFREAREAGVFVYCVGSFRVAGI